MYTLEFDPRTYIVSEYSPDEHKYAGWYWVREKQAFMRWKDMMDFYKQINETEE